MMVKEWSDCIEVMIMKLQDDYACSRRLIYCFDIVVQAQQNDVVSEGAQALPFPITGSSG